MAEEVQPVSSKCPTCGQYVTPLTGGPAIHGRFGWYVALQGPESRRVQLVVYAEGDVRESAIARARLLLMASRELAAYGNWAVLPVTSNGMTTRGGDIEVYAKPEGIA